MSTFNNQTKHSATFNQVSKNIATFDPQEKSGTGWSYNELNLSYNSEVDPDGGDIIYYNGIGTPATYTNLTKH